jgi:hypothetical protein
VQRDNCGNVATDTTLDMVNNVVANWSSYPDPDVAGQGTVVRDGATANLRGNYYTNPHVPPGNVQRQRNAVFVCGTPTTSCPSDDPGFAYVPTGSNLLGDQPTWDLNVEATTSIPFAAPTVPLVTACEAATWVLNHSGGLSHSVDEQAEVDSVSVSGC